MTNINNKILKAIKATEKWLEEVKKKNKDTREFTDYGLTIYGCEKRNLEEYKQILITKDKRKLTGRLRELYLTI